MNGLPPGISEALAGLVAVLLTALATWISAKLKARKAIKAAKAVPNTLAVGVEIYKLLNAALTQLGAMRVIILRASNGGKIPRPGCPLSASVIYEVYQGDDTVEAVQPDFQSYPLDEHYIEMLNELERRATMRPAPMITGVVNVVTDLPEHAMLKGIYMGQDARWSYVEKIFEGEGSYWYLSLVYKDGGQGPSKTESAIWRTRVNTLTNALRNILEPHYDVPSKEGK